MTTPTDWFFQNAETEAAWTQAELGEDGWQLYQQLMGDAAPAPASAPGGAVAPAAPPASGAAPPPSTTTAAPAAAREPGASLPLDTNETPSAAPAVDPGAALAAAPAASPAVVWPAMAYLSAELVGAFVTDMLALTPPGLTKNRVNDWVRAHGCSHNEGVVRKGLLNWLRAAGVLENPNAGLAPHFTETDLATIAQRLRVLPYHTDMERDR